MDETNNGNNRRNKMKLKPVNDKIVVKINSKEEEVTESGILLPDTVDQGKLMEGEVVAVGNGMYSASGTLIPVVVDVGDKILYNKHAQLHEYDDDLVIMSINEILSIVED
jgi:chaperonin GroES